MLSYKQHDISFSPSFLIISGLHEGLTQPPEEFSVKRPTYIQNSLTEHQRREPYISNAHRRNLQSANTLLLISTVCKNFLNLSPTSKIKLFCTLCHKPRRGWVYSSISRLSANQVVILLHVHSKP